MNLLLPVSVTAGTVLTVWLCQAAAAASDVRAAGLTFVITMLVITMLVLAIVEHWVLVLPLPFAKLWSWILQLRRPARPPAPPAPATRLQILGHN